ncbi:MAG: hypothetical protein K8S00_06835, partial [Bacteroidales bacterium]|nr:hypothetical protein [Bacteroidales bacterium]
MQDYTQIYLIGLKFYITKIWPYWGPDITYTFSQIPGALQGLLVGLPFYILEIPESPFLLLNILSTFSLVFFAWYLSKRFIGIPKWFLYVWLLTAPWTLNYSTTVINPSYVLAPAILFFVSIFELLPFYKEKIFSINLSYFIIGFTLGWILQIHMSWVLLPFYILLSFYFLLKTRKLRIILFGLLFFCLGFILIMSTYIPTIIKYGFITGDVESNIVINFSNLKNVDVFTRFIAFSTFEARYFIAGGSSGEKALLLNNLWAAPFIIILFFIGILQTLYYIIYFFKKTSHIEFKYVKLFTIGTILLIYISYLFVVRDVASHTFYVLLPISFWFSCYCLENLFKKSFWRRFAVFFILSGLIYHIALAKEYFPTNSLTSKKIRIQQALKNKDSRLFAYRRVANWEKNEREKYWRRIIIINTIDTSITYINSFDDFESGILPESLNRNHYISQPYSCQVDSINPFSIGLSKQLKDFNYKRQVSISLFVRYSEINDCILVLSIDKKGKSLLWTGDKICNEYKDMNRWKQIT